ncbi:hypothetical protein [Nonomuraea jabiensis]|uniref:Uncharacterized protein n=1 Tax=Nonomuraea jabiensis TaxID=882448 RepID=A0A7W9G7M3_9ACTN|nr:hypothetical protein [Nonomuraea jabiensis]MBB5778666.1 hypothetical protein [Nonomuraea jabiensis]
MPKEIRTSFGNMLLLCEGHHVQIDNKDNEKKFPKELLHEWKKAHEGDAASALNRISGLTEDRLKDLMLTAITTTKHDLLGAVNDLKSSSKETVETLRSLMLEAFDRPYDSAQLLYEAASRLRHLEDNTHLLYEAARRLSHLQDNTSLLYSASQKLGNLEDNTSLLLDATRQLEGLGDRIYMFRSAANEIPWHLLESFVESSNNASFSSQNSGYADSGSFALNKATVRIEEVVQELQELRAIQADEVQSHTQWPPSPAGWIWIKRGFFTGLALAAAVVITIIALTTNGGA